MEDIKKKISVTIITTICCGAVLAAAGIYTDVTILKEKENHNKVFRSDVKKVLNRIDNRIYDIHRYIQRK